MTLVPAASACGVKLLTILRYAGSGMTEHRHVIRVASLVVGYVSIKGFSRGSASFEREISRIFALLRCYYPSFICIVAGKLISMNNTGRYRHVLDLFGTALILSQAIQLFFVSNALTHQAYNAAFPQPQTAQRALPPPVEDHPQKKRFYLV